MKSSRVTDIVVQKVAQLAKLPINPAQKKKFVSQLSSVIEYVSKVQAMDTEQIEETSQVTGLMNVFREDLIDATRMLTQQQALSNAKKIDKGYFVVPAVFEE